MAASGAILTDVHATLLEALSVLDAAGEYAASAHLVAAIEVLENGIERAAGRRLATDANNPVAALARHMTEQFGDRAQAVARSQLEDANGPALLAWAAIINRMAG